VAMVMTLDGNSHMASIWLAVKRFEG